MVLNGGDATDAAETDGGVVLKIFVVVLLILLFSLFESIDFQQ